MCVCVGGGGGGGGEGRRGGGPCALPAHDVGKGSASLEIEVEELIMEVK